MANWARYQRRRLGQLSRERVERLSAIPGWVWDSHAERFEARATEYAAFVARYGRPPRRHASEPAERSLGVWAAELRARAARRRLAYERLQVAAALGIIPARPPADGGSKTDLPDH